MIFLDRVLIAQDAGDRRQENSGDISSAYMISVRESFLIGF